jgi:hypothetical protein
MYDRHGIDTAYLSKNIYNMATIVVFLVVLWRHYQKDSRIIVFIKFGIVLEIKANFEEYIK